MKITESYVHVLLLPIGSLFLLYHFSAFPFVRQKETRVIASLSIFKNQMISMRRLSPFGFEKCESSHRNFLDTWSSSKLECTTAIRFTKSRLSVERLKTFRRYVLHIRDHDYHARLLDQLVRSGSTPWPWSISITPNLPSDLRECEVIDIWKENLVQFVSFGTIRVLGAGKNRSVA